MACSRNIIYHTNRRDCFIVLMVYGIASLPLYTTLITDKNCSGLCTTKECVEASKLYLSNLDEGVDPCEDAFAFACGRYERMRTYNDLNDVSLTQELLINKMREVLENIEGSLNSHSGILKAVYDSCLDENSSEFDALSTFDEYLQELGIFGWPHLDDTFRFNKMTPYQALAVYESYAKECPLVSEDNEYRFKVLWIGPPSETDPDFIWNPIKNELGWITLTGGEGDVPSGNGTLLKFNVRRCRLNSDINKHTDIFLNRTLAYLDVDAARIEIILGDFKDMIRSIENIKGNESDATAINCSLESGDSFFPLCEAIKHYSKYNKLEHLYSTSELKVGDISYARDLSLLLNNITHRTFANFLAVQLLLQNRKVLDLYLGSMSRDLFRDLSDYHYNPLLVKWRHCVELTNEHLSQLLRPEYVRQAIAPDLDEIKKITDFYIGITAYIMKKQTWIEESRRLRFSDKIQSHINRLDNNVNAILHSSTMDVIYGDFRPIKDNFFRNTMMLRKHLLRKNFMYPLILLMGDIFAMSDPFEVNAYSHSFSSGTELLFGILLPPMYARGLPKLLNFATLGDIVGHELGHEIHSYFEDYDTFDESLDNETRDNFLQKKKCLTQQYSSFDIKGLGEKAMGNATFSEDIGDLIGAELTQKMVEMFLEEQGESAIFSLPSFNYTCMQTIYIATAQFWCSKMTSREKLHLFRHDDHSLNELRVSGKAQNSKAYSQAFNCAPGTNMNPARTCSFFDNI